MLKIIVVGMGWVAVLLLLNVISRSPSKTRRMNFQVVGVAHVVKGIRPRFNKIAAGKTHRKAWYGYRFLPHGLPTHRDCRARKFHIYRNIKDSTDEKNNNTCKTVFWGS